MKALQLNILPLLVAGIFSQAPAIAQSITLPSTVTISNTAINNPSVPSSSGTGYFTLTLSGIPGGYSITNQPYAAWCGSWFNASLQNATSDSPLTALPIYNTSPSAVPAIYNPLNPPDNFSMVNYILNNKQGTVAEVQDAIWLIMTGFIDSGHSASSATQSMVALARANASYVPTSGVVAAFIQIVPNALANNPTAGGNVFQNLLIEVPAPVTTTISALCSSGSAQVGSAYSSSLSASGGTGSYTFALSGGSLPAGLSITSAGLISGTPTTAAIFPFTFTATDSAGHSTSGTGQSCSITVVPRTLSLACAGATTGQVGSAYSSSLVATGGTPAYTYSILSGTLPPALSLAPSTGLISGTATTVGTYSFIAKVVDSATTQAGATSSCGITISNVPPPTIGHGDTATIGFWHNRNGQYIISILNGGGTSKLLANWLANNYPYLYGVNSTTNLTNMTNANVAAYFMTLFNVSGQKTYAQILGGALASYTTSTTLGGTDAVIVAARSKFGFNSSTGGTGSRAYNVGSNGAAAGLTNNTSYTVSQLLVAANFAINNGTFNANAFNSIFDGINQSGDII